MAEPMDVIMAIHNAFRKDMKTIDFAALQSARGIPGFTDQIERFRFFNEILVWHAHGEELAIFPALEKVAPSVAEAYERDHHGLDAAFEAMFSAVSSHDALETARAAAAFKFHLDIHLDKEDAHLYRLIRERVSLQDQSKAVGAMSTVVPQDRFPEAIAWMFPLLSNADRENITRVWQMLMPPLVFDRAKHLIKNALGKDWVELTRRNPTLT